MPLAAAAAVTIAAAAVAMVVVRNFHLLLSRCHLIRTYAHTHIHNIHVYMPMMNIYRNPITLHFFIQYHQYGHPIKSTSCESNGKYGYMCVMCVYIYEAYVCNVYNHKSHNIRKHTRSYTRTHTHTVNEKLAACYFFLCSLLFSLQIALVWCAHMFSIFVPYGNWFKSNKRFQVT